MRRLRRRGRARLLNVLGRRINQVHRVAQFRQPQRVNPRAAAHVQNDGRRRRQIAREEFLRADAFKLSRHLTQSPGLVAALVMGCHL